MTLSIFSCVYWPFLHLLWRNVYSSTLPIKKNFTYLFLAVLGLHCYTDFSLAAASRGYSLAGARGVLIAVASLDAEHDIRACAL